MVASSQDHVCGKNVIKNIIYFNKLIVFLLMQSPDHLFFKLALWPGSRHLHLVQGRWYIHTISNEIVDRYKQLKLGIQLI